MAHELTFNARGKADMLSVGETPWHREGIVLAAAPRTLGEAMDLTNINFVVEKRPTFRAIAEMMDLGGVQVATGKVDYVQNDEAFITARTDTGAELGAVGPGYVPIQNYDAFRALEPLIEQGVVTIETCGSLRGGADVWMLCKFNMAAMGDQVKEVFGDEVVPYALATNNHNGRRSAYVALTPIRVVCANTLGAAEDQMDSESKLGGVRSIEVKHTKNGPTEIVAAAEKLFQGIVARFEVVAKQYRLLKQTTLNEAAFQELVIDTVVQDPRKAKRFNPDARLAESVVDRYGRKVEAIRAAWTGGRGHTGDMSAWEAYNGAVEVLDHNAELFPNRRGTYRTASLLDGVIAQTKNTVLEKVVAYAHSRNN